MSDKEAAISWAKLWIDSEFSSLSSQRTRTIARYILSTANADPPQSVVTLTLADYETLKARADGRVATAWSDANEFIVRVMELFRLFACCPCDADLGDYERAKELIDQWDRRHKTVTTEGDVQPEGATGTL